MPPVATIDIHLFAVPSECLLRSRPEAPQSQGNFQDDLIEVTSDQLCPFDCSMEQLGELLALQPRCYFEWDGSFVWTGELDQDRPNQRDAAGNDAGWTLSGMVYDIGTQISRIELRGQCPLAPVHQITQWLQSTDRHLVVQLMASGTYIDGSDLEKIWHA